MAIATPKNRKKEKTKKTHVIVTPFGRFSYMYISKPDNTGVYRTDLLIHRKDMASTAGREMIAKFNEVCQSAFGCDFDELEKPPLVDLSEDPKTAEEFKQYFRLRCKTYKDPSEDEGEKPGVYNAQTIEMSDKEISTLKSGDYGRICLSTYTMDNKHGQFLGLKILWLQFKCSGEAFGSNAKAEALNLLDEVEVEDSEIPEPKSSKKSKKDEEDDVPDYFNN